MNVLKLTAVLVIALAILLPQESFSQKEKMTLGGDIGLAMPTGDFGDGANTGFGVNGVFSYFINPQLIVTGNLGYWSFSAKESSSAYSVTFSTIPVLGGIQYRFNTSKFQPFVSAETLMFFNSVKVSVSGYGSESRSETEFGFVPGVGAAFPVSPTMEIRAMLKYNIIFTSGSNTTFLVIGGGVHFVI